MKFMITFTESKYIYRLINQWFINIFLPKHVNSSSSHNDFLYNSYFA